MIKIAVLWIVSIILSYAGMAVKERYSPARRMGDFLLTAFLHLLLCLQLAAVYFTGTKTALLSAVLLIAFNYYWFYFTPFYPNSDPAGNGMARGFRSIIITFGAVTYGIVSFFLIRFLVIDGIRFGLYIVLVIAAYIGLYNIWANRRSFISGDSLNSSARWERMSVDDYRKTLLRMDLVEKLDSWEAKELDASPEEMDHWDVYGCKCINIKAADGLPCVLVRGDFVYSDGRASLHPMGLEWGCLGYTGERNANDRNPESFIPDTINLVWRDLSDGRTYQIQTELPKELSVYFEDSDRFWLDDIELRIMGKGKVWMFHNRTNQIHNICMDHPLVGTLTNEFDQAAEELILKYKINAEKYKGLISPDADIIDDYVKRFPYTISFRSENDRFVITKTICNFFNGEKILSGGEWKENTDPARIKDIFLRFEGELRRYACFVYFSEEEILKVFGEAFGNADHGVFTVTVGNDQDAFSFELKLGNRSFILKDTEIRLYKMDEDDRGKIVWKNYKGRHKNLLNGLEIRTAETKE